MKSEQTVIVTGAAKGLGLSISQMLTDAGYFVIGIGRSNSSEFENISTDMRYFIEFDLMDLSAIPQLFQKIKTSSPGQIYGLVNNAGVGLDGTLATQHPSDITRMLTLNLEAPIILTKYAIRYMLRQKEGRIINISSIIASTGFNGLAAYGASKAGLEGFTRSISREVGRAGITVNCVAPGYMLTAMTEGLGGSKLESIKRRAPLGLPETINAAHAVRFLLEPHASKTTGTVITVDGGSTA